MKTLVSEKINITFIKSLLIIISIISIACFFKNIKNDTSIVTAHSQRELYYTSVSIEANDTLWDIASTYYSDEYNSVQDFIDEIKELNNMGSDVINAGNKILIPYYK